MILVTTRHAAKHALRLPVLRSDVTTRRARLGRVRRRYRQHHRAETQRLLLQEDAEPSPVGLENPAVEPRLLRHVSSRLLGRAFRRGGHATDMEVFEHHDAVVLGVAVRETMQQGLHLPASLLMHTGQILPGLGPVLRALLLSSDVALSLGDLDLGLVQEGGPWFQVTVGVGEDVGDAPINSDGGTGRVGHDVHVLGDVNGDKPRLAVPRDRGAGGLAFDGAVEDDGNVADLREAQRPLAMVEFDRPRLATRLGHGHGVVPLGLEARFALRLGEEVGPRRLHLMQRGLLHVTGHVLEPIHGSAEVRQFLVLRKERRVDLGATKTLKPKETLLMSEVPQEPQGPFPATEPCFLLGRGIDAVLEAPMKLHVRGFIFVTKVGQGQSLRLAPPRPEGRGPRQLSEEQKGRRPMDRSSGRHSESLGREEQGNRREGSDRMYFEVCEIRVRG